MNQLEALAEDCRAVDHLREIVERGTDEQKIQTLVI